MATQPQAYNSPHSILQCPMLPPGNTWEQNRQKDCGQSAPYKVGGSEPPFSGFLISKEHAHSLAVHTVHRDCQSSPHCKPMSKKGFNSQVRNVSSPWRRSLFQMGVLSGWKWRKNSPHAKLHPPFPKMGEGQERAFILTSIFTNNPGQ